MTTKKQFRSSLVVLGIFTTIFITMAFIFAIWYEMIGALMAFAFGCYFLGAFITLYSLKKDLRIENNE